MKNLINYTLPKEINQLFYQNCNLYFEPDFCFYQYIFATFDAKGQLPNDNEEQIKLALALIKFHHNIFSLIDDCDYEEEIDTDPLESLNLNFDYKAILNNPYQKTNILNLLRKNFKATDIFLLIMIFFYDYDSLRDYYEENDTDYDDIIVGVVDLEDYIQVLECNMICSDILNSGFYIDAYGYVYQEIDELI